MSSLKSIEQFHRVFFLQKKAIRYGHTGSICRKYSLKKISLFRNQRKCLNVDLFPT